jgi:hypothetical protein
MLAQTGTAKGLFHAVALEVLALAGRYRGSPPPAGLIRAAAKIDGD